MNIAAEMVFKTPLHCAADDKRTATAELTTTAPPSGGCAPAPTQVSRPGVSSYTTHDCPVPTSPVLPRTCTRVLTHTHVHSYLHVSESTLNLFDFEK